jgi:hypothetical protein
MIETFFDRSFAIDRLRQGPLGGSYRFASQSVVNRGLFKGPQQLRYIGHFNRWLDRRGLTANQIDEEMIERFWRSFMRRKKVRRGDMSALFTLLDFLREQGVTPQRTIKAVLTPRESHVENL